MADEPRKVKIGGHDVTIVSDEEAEKVDYVVCMPADTLSPFRDNVRANCWACGKPIIHRPHVPKKPPKICVDCATLFAQTSDTVH